MRRHAWLVPILVALSLAVAACPSRKSVETYRKDGLHFSYLSDWKVSEDRPLPGSPKVREVVLHGPDHALLMFLCFPETSSVSLERFAAGVAKRAQGGDHRAGRDQASHRHRAGLAESL